MEAENPLCCCKPRNARSLWRFGQTSRDSPLLPLKRVWLCQHPDSRLVASATVSVYISSVCSHHVCGDLLRQPSEMNTAYELCLIKAEVLCMMFLKERVNCPRRNSGKQGLMDKGLGNSMDDKSGKNNLVV